MGSTASGCRTKASSLALTAGPDSSESVNAQLSLVRVVRTRRRSPVSSRHWFLPVQFAPALPALLPAGPLHRWMTIDRLTLNCPLEFQPRIQAALLRRA